MNTVEAIWMKSPSEVDDAKYDEFYKFIAKAYDEPLAKVGRVVCWSVKISRKHAPLPLGGGAQPVFAHDASPFFG